MAESFIPYESLKEHYNADALIFWCFDARFSDAYNEFLKQRGFAVSKIDLVKAAGGAQALAAESGADHEMARSQIEKSIKLHHTDHIILMVHMDCGGYGGSRAFGSDHQKEWDHHSAELKKAEAFVRAEFSAVKEIECWIADFDGLHLLS